MGTAIQTHIPGGNKCLEGRYLSTDFVAEAPPHRVRGARTARRFRAEKLVSRESGEVLLCRSRLAAN